MRISKRIALLSLATLSTLTTVSQAQAEWGIFAPANIEERIRKEIAKQDVGASLKIFSAEVFDGLNLALKYRIESEPSYVNGFYTRIDKYTFDTSVKPGDIIDDMDMPISFNIDKGAELIFARQFKSQKDSLIALPYTLRQIPLTAERAIRNLNVGDFVGLEANLAFVMSLSGSSLSEGLSVHGSTHAFISGKFMVHLLRLPNNKMRVKLISLNSRGAGLSADAEYGLDLDILGLKYIERKLDKVIDLSPLNLDSNKSKNNVFMLDYVFDLNNPQAAQAYDEMMTRKVQLQELKAANPLLTVEKMASLILNDLSAVEDIAAEDRMLQASKRRISTLFKGTNQSRNSSSNFKLGINLLKIEDGISRAQSHVTSYDRNNNPQKYILETNSKRFKTKGLFGLWGAETTNSSSMLFLADDKFKPLEFIALSTDKLKKESELDKGDLKDLKNEVRALIPDSEFQKIRWSAYDFANGSYVNSAYRIQIFFHPEALMAMPQMLSTEDVARRFAAYSKSVGPLNVPVANEAPWADGNTRVGPYRYELDYQEIAKLLKQVKDSSLRPQERLDCFNKLRRIPAWEARGMGFLISLLPKSQLSQLISFEFSLTSKDGPTLTHKYGQFEQEGLYDALMYTQNVISNHGFDLRLWTDENGEYTVRSQRAP